MSPLLVLIYTHEYRHSPAGTGALVALSPEQLGCFCLLWKRRGLLFGLESHIQVRSHGLVGHYLHETSLRRLMSLAQHVAVHF